MIQTFWNNQLSPSSGYKREQIVERPVYDVETVRTKAEAVNLLMGPNGLRNASSLLCIILCFFLFSLLFYSDDRGRAGSPETFAALSAHIQDMLSLNIS
jgi:hypothetical protein